MTTRDTPEAALIAALHAAYCNPSGHSAGEFALCSVKRAAAILAALDGWALVRKGPYIDEAEHDRQSSVGTHLFDEGCPYCSAAEITRLTRELDAARTLAATEYGAASAEATASMLTQQEAEDMGRHAAQQAIAAERARIAAAVRGLPWTVDDRMRAMKRAVLAVIEEGTP